MTMETIASDSRLPDISPARGSESKPEDKGKDPRGTWRLVGLLAGAAGLAFWIYTFYAIAQVPVGDGSGFQWLAEVPLTMIFLFVTVPAAALSSFRKTAQAGGILSIAGLVAFLLLWAQLLKELHGG